MRLLVISTVVHYTRDGKLVGHGPTVTEISHLARIFDEIHHVACFHPGEAPAMALPYTTEHIHLIPVPVAGGTRLRDKLNILRLSPLYIRVILKALPQAEVVHIRCPANLSLIAIVLLALVKKPRLRWVKYAGNWQPTSLEAWSSRFQRWWLEQGFHRGFVTVNGKWPEQPDHVRTFINPCITNEELEAAEQIAHAKTFPGRLRLLFVGMMYPPKGADRALQIVQRLRTMGIPLFFDLVGEGPARSNSEHLAVELGIADCVQFHGSLPRSQLNDLYAQSHIMLFPSSSSEGWPKVLSESMAYGVVPVSSNVSSIPQYLIKYEVGKALPPYDLDAFSDAIVEYYEHPDIWKKESLNGLVLARLFSYNNYLQDVRILLGLCDK
jgi:glycosyltransferase involved in cell wall biosynthesis